MTSLLKFLSCCILSGISLNFENWLHIVVSLESEAAEAHFKLLVYCEPVCGVATTRNEDFGDIAAAVRPPETRRNSQVQLNLFKQLVRHCCLRSIYIIRKFLIISKGTTHEAIGISDSTSALIAHFGVMIIVVVDQCLEISNFNLLSSSLALK